jgi:dTDP-4-amino-4,6-dideoxygalactose transaminase
VSTLSRLAVYGGKPTIPEGPPPWPRPNEAVREALAEAYADGSWGRYHGPNCERLKAALAELCQCQHVWTCCSGTLAVELALRGLKVGPGDEVILAAYDFPGNFRAIEAIGARPVLVDLTPGTWTIDAANVAGAISSSTKAIIASHLHGSLADMPRLRAIADAAGIVIVEDACQAPGALVASKPAGSWGDCGVLSFGGSKLLTAGRGGAVVTQRDDVLHRIRIYCERGNDAFPLSELQAAVLLPQLAGLESENFRRMEAVNVIAAQTVDLPLLAPTTLPADPAFRPVFYKLPWLVSAANDDDLLRAQIVEALRAEGVALDAGFRGFARRSSLRCRAMGDLTFARRAAAGTVILHHPVLLEPAETLVRVANALRKVCLYFASRGTDSVSEPVPA